jgi:Fic family protein
MRYIYQQPGWPCFQWDAVALSPLLAAVRLQQGLVIGRMGVIGFALAAQANLEVATQDILGSTKIEGENLDPAEVRSSVARRLGIPTADPVHSGREVDGVVEMTLDATGNFAEPLTRDRLFAWHSSLFPLARSGMRPIRTGAWRTDENGPMQVVSGALGRERVHFQAPDAATLDQEVRRFLAWVEDGPQIDPVVKSALAHLWFVTLHPFEDGNGRIARAIGDLLLARSDQQPMRFYSLSTQICTERNAYYDCLEHTQHGDMDVSAWVTWYLECLRRALTRSDDLLSRVIFKHRFWATCSARVENVRQKKILDKLLDDSLGSLTSSKWARIVHCSQDTALRDIQKLMEQGILQKLDRGGRSTAYGLRKDLLD